MESRVLQVLGTRHHSLSQGQYIGSWRRSFLSGKSYNSGGIKSDGMAWYFLVPIT